MIQLEDKTYSVLSRIWTRFIFLYLVFYIFPYGFEYIQELDTNDISIWENITIWFGEHFFGWEFNKEQLLKGFDSKYDYSRFTLITFLATFGTFIWIMVDSKFIFNYNYNSKLKTLTRTILRYHVGLTLIIYGLAKMLMLQFGEMDLDRLESSIGSKNGMGFLWNFMSYSKFYTMSTGWIEFIGGAFLLFRRTTFIGTIILTISMINVVLIDIGYDVRVKMFAIHLLVMNIILLSVNFKRMFTFFVMNKVSKPVNDQPLFFNNSYRNVGYLLKGALLIYFIVSCFISFNERIEAHKGNSYISMSKFHEITVQLINGEIIPKTNENRWNSISINGNSNRPETLKITTIDNAQSIYSFVADTIQKTINFNPLNGTESYNLQYEELPNKNFIFKGYSTLGDSIWIRTKSKSIKDYPLTSNGIKWVTDLK